MWRGLTDGQRARVSAHLPVARPSPKGGRPRADDRRCFDGAGTPLGAHLDSASPHEVTLLERTLATIAVPRAHTPGRPRQRPDRLIADRAYDSNPLRARLAGRGIEPIIPALPNHLNATHQDGRKLRRYRHRWIVERTFSWLGTFRRLVVRYERLLLTYAGFFHLACAMRPSPGYE